MDGYKPDREGKGVEIAGRVVAGYSKLRNRETPEWGRLDTVNT